MSDLKNLLYVDDEVMNLFLFENLLSKNFNIVTANNPEKALETLKENDSFDIVISDMKMPRMNGIEFIKKAKEFYTKCPYMILSGYGRIPEIEEALDTNLICGYLQKPFDVNAIARSINQEIEKFQPV